MYMFTEKQKAELFDAGVTIHDVAEFHGTDDNAWLSADEAMDGLYRWYMGDDDRDGDRDIPYLTDPARYEDIEHPNVHASCYEECELPVDRSHADGSWAIPF